MNTRLLYFDRYIDGENLSYRMNGNDMYLYIPNNDDDEQYNVMYKFVNTTQFVTTRWQCVYSGRQNRYYYTLIEDGLLAVDEEGYGNYMLNLYDWGIIEFWADSVEKVKPNYDLIVAEIKPNSCCYDRHKLHYNNLYFEYVNKVKYCYCDVEENELKEIPESEWAKNDFYVSSYCERDLAIGKKPLNHYCLKTKGLGCFEILAKALHEATDTNDFMRLSISSEADRKVAEVAEDLKTGRMTVDDLPIGIIYRDGNPLILNTRSAMALTQAGIPRSQWKAVDKTGYTDAEEILTRRLKNNGLDNNGIKEVRISGGSK